MLDLLGQASEGIEGCPADAGRRSSTRLPSARQVAMLPQAREEPHPSVMNETFSTLPFRTINQNSMVSPQGPVMRA